MPKRTPSEIIARTIRTYHDQAEQLAHNQKESSSSTALADISKWMFTTPSYGVDVGAGLGHNAAYLQYQGHHMVAAEPAEAMNLLGRKTNPQLHWTSDALPRIPTLRAMAKAKPFDFMLCNAVWMHLPPESRQESLTCMAQCLRPGGRLFIITQNAAKSPRDRPKYFMLRAEFRYLAEAAGMGVVAIPTPRGDKNRLDIRWQTAILSRDAH